MKENILGYEVDSLSEDSCVEGIIEHIRDKKGFSWLACLNPHSYAESLKDASFGKALCDARWLIPDGIGVVLASRFRGGQIKNRLTGPDIFYALLNKLNNQKNYSVFFLGSTEDTLEKIQLKMGVDYPNVKVAGVYSPPFKADYSADEITSMVNAINDSGADVLWVGMTAPKQEKWIYFNQDRLKVSFAGAIGAVFDFYTGKVKRSHPIFRNSGLEWLPRLLQQPKRLWRRTFVSVPVFLWHVITNKSIRKHN